jgi:hypothetical protein
VRARHGVLAAGLATGLVLSTGGAAVAADPEASTLTAPKKTGTVTSAWSGAFDYPGFELASILGTTDSHTLTITIPGKKPEKYFKKKAATVHIDLTWDGGSANDMDLYVYDAAGTEVASSAQAATEGEAVTIPVTGSATYTVEVVNYLSAPATAYQATATLTVTGAAPAAG